MENETPPPPALPELADEGRFVTGPAPEERDGWIFLGLAGLMLAFLALGLVWVAFADNIPWADADFYFRGAKSIADGNGYSHPFKTGHPPTAFHPVGYPWFLAHVWTVFGVDTGNCDVSTWPALDGCNTMIETAQIANVLIATLNIGLVFALGWVLKGPRIGLLAALIFALIPSRFLFTSALMSEESFVALVLMALILLIVSVRRPDRMWLTALGFGLAVGAATYMRPLGILLLGIPLLLLFWRPISVPRTLVFAGIAAVAAVALLLPWEIRNHNEVGGVNLVSNNGGINLWIGCHQDADGSLTSNGKWMDWWSGNAPRSINTDDEFANDRKARDLALQCMREQPVEFARLSLAKGLYTFREDWTYVSNWSLNHDLPDQPTEPIVSNDVEEALGYLSNSIYLALLPLAAVGAVAMLFGPSIHRWLLAAAFAVLALVPLSFFGEPRFHMPLLPIMSVWAADGLRIIVHGLRSAGRDTGEERPRPATPYELEEKPWPM
ncbi:MAG: hypothetical protein U1B78_00920 [Dehalococcoidia bacterium]|nr:hypothetical protein [Dehalococcoidia bacterium]